MQNIKTEFLVSQDKKTTTCNDRKRIISALNSNSIFEVTESEIKYDKISFKISIKELSTNTAEHRCFHIVVESKKTEIEKFIKLKNILERDLIKHFNNNVQVIWNDIDAHFSALAYPLIKNTENLMRKFLTQFFLMNIGVEWVNKSVPDIINSKLERQGRTTESNYLSSTDFIDLSIFLFKEHTKHNSKILSEKINSANKIEDLDEIKEMLPKSNWERYFKKLITIDASQFEKDWEELYKLRCKVAHNNSFNDRDLKKLQELIKKVDPIIEKFIEEIINIHIPEDEKEFVFINNEAHNHILTSGKNGSFVTLNHVNPDQINKSVIQTLREIEKYGAEIKYDLDKATLATLKNIAGSSLIRSEVERLNRVKLYNSQVSKYGNKEIERLSSELQNSFNLIKDASHVISEYEKDSDEDLDKDV